MKKRLFAILLTVCLVVSMAPAALAADCSGECSHEAAIGNVHYDTFAEAITAANAATEAVTIELLSNVKLSTGITVNNPNAVKTTIDGAKHTITPVGDANFTGIVVTARTNLEIIDTTIDGFITTSDVLNAYKGADLTLTGCVVQNNQCRTVVRTQSGYADTVIATGTKFIENTAINGVVYCGDGNGSYSLEGCTVDDNDCTAIAAPVTLPGAVSIKNSSFTDNTTTSTWSYAASAAY